MYGRIAMRRREVADRRQATPAAVGIVTAGSSNRGVIVNRSPRIRDIASIRSCDDSRVMTDRMLLEMEASSAFQSGVRQLPAVRLSSARNSQHRRR